MSTIHCFLEARFVLTKGRYKLFALQVVHSFTKRGGEVILKRMSVCLRSIKKRKTNCRSYFAEATFLLVYCCELVACKKDIRSKIEY